MERNQKDGLPNAMPSPEQGTEIQALSLRSTMKKLETRKNYLASVKSMYLTGTPVTKIAKLMGKSRWGIYLALKSSGVDTSLGLRGKRRVPNKVGDYLNDAWKNEPIGRSPTQIAARLNVPIEMVHTTLKNRRNSLLALGERMPFEEVLVGGSMVDYTVDPYRLRVSFHGRDGEGKEKFITMTEGEMREVLNKMQSG